MATRYQVVDSERNDVVISSHTNKRVALGWRRDWVTFYHAEDGKRSAKSYWDKRIKLHRVTSEVIA